MQCSCSDCHLSELQSFSISSRREVSPLYCTDNHHLNLDAQLPSSTLPRVMDDLGWKHSPQHPRWLFWLRAQNCVRLHSLFRARNGDQEDGSNKSINDPLVSSRTCVFLLSQCVRSTPYRAHNSRDTRTSFYIVRVHVAQGPPRLKTFHNILCLFQNNHTSSLFGS